MPHGQIKIAAVFNYLSIYLRFSSRYQGLDEKKRKLSIKNGFQVLSGQTFFEDVGYFASKQYSNNRKKNNLKNQILTVCFCI